MKYYIYCTYYNVDELSYDDWSWEPADRGVWAVASWGKSLILDDIV